MKYRENRIYPDFHFANVCARDRQVLLSVAGGIGPVFRICAEKRIYEFKRLNFIHML